MSDLLRFSDSTDAELTIQVLSDRVATLSSDLAKWKVEVAVEVVISSLQLKITAKKPNGQGFIKTFNREDVAYYSNDPDSLIQELVDVIFENLLKQQIKDEITRPVTQAIKNIDKIMGKMQ